MNLLHPMMIYSVHVMINHENYNGFIEISKNPKCPVDVSTIFKERKF